MTELFPWTISYTNGVYSVSQPTNGNLIFEIPLAKAEIATHPSIANYFYFGSPSLTLDQSLITNITPVSRTATIAYVISLAIPTPVSATISSLPSNALNNQGVATNTISANGTAIALRVIAGSGQYIKLRELNAVTALGLGTWTQINITKNPTPTGGTWTAAFPGSIVEKNNLSGFSSSGGQLVWSGFVRSERGFPLNSSEPTFVNGDVLVVAVTFFATTSAGINLIWNEKT